MYRGYKPLLQCEKINRGYKPLPQEKDRRMYRGYKALAQCEKIILTADC